METNTEVGEVEGGDTEERHIVYMWCGEKSKLIILVMDFFF